jgi:hypothetical protein
MIFDQPFRQPSKTEISRWLSSFCEMEYTKPEPKIVDIITLTNQMPDETSLITGNACDIAGTI